MSCSLRSSREWEDMCIALKSFHAREGHCHVPWAHQEGRLRVGAWLSEQWREQRAGRLSHARQLRLARIGVIWNGKHPPVREANEADGHNEAIRAPSSHTRP